MNLTSSLLYLLMLFAVLDKDGKLSVTTGLVLGCGILLCNCYFGNRGTACNTCQGRYGTLGTMNGF